MAAGTLTVRPGFPLMTWPTSLSRRVVAAVRAHPDLVVMTALMIVGLVVRAMLLTRAPLFLRRDSVAYYQVGWEFANGLGFDLPLRRTPLYPLFIAGVVWLLGEDLRGLALAQHLLGLVTVVSTYFLGRAMLGRLTGSVAALAVAVSAPLLIYEHYILAEPLFIPLLVLGLLLIVLALRRDGVSLDRPPFNGTFPVIAERLRSPPTFAQDDTSLDNTRRENAPGRVAF